MGSSFRQTGRTEWDGGAHAPDLGGRSSRGRGWSVALGTARSRWRDRAPSRQPTVGFRGLPAGFTLNIVQYLMSERSPTFMRVRQTACPVAKRGRRGSTRFAVMMLPVPPCSRLGSAHRQFSAISDRRVAGGRLTVPARAHRARAWGNQCHKVPRNRPSPASRPTCSGTGGARGPEAHPPSRHPRSTEVNNSGRVRGR